MAKPKNEVSKRRNSLGYVWCLDCSIPTNEKKGATVYIKNSFTGETKEEFWTHYKYITAYCKIKRKTIQLNQWRKCKRFKQKTDPVFPSLDGEES